MAKGGQSSKSGGDGREALRRLEAGDVWAARLLARRVLSAAEAGAVPAEELEAAREVLSRTAFPKEALQVGALAATLIVLLILLGALRG